MALLLVYKLIEDPPWVKRAKGAGIRFDYIGVSLLVLGVGALQVMLDKGQEDDWFGSRFILTLAVVAAVSSFPLPSGNGLAKLLLLMCVFSGI